MCDEYSPPESMDWREAICVGLGLAAGVGGAGKVVSLSDRVAGSAGWSRADESYGRANFLSDF